MRRRNNLHQVLLAFGGVLMLLGVVSSHPGFSFLVGAVVATIGFVLWVRTLI